MKKGDKIFLYGTLRPGEMRYPVMIRHGSVPIGEALLKDAAIYSIGGAFPALKLNVPGHNVHGFVMEVTDEKLVDALDRIEGYPYLYDRCKVETSRGSCWTYVFAREGELEDRMLIKGGDWLKRDKAA